MLRGIPISVHFNFRAMFSWSPGHKPGEVMDGHGTWNHHWNHAAFSGGWCEEPKGDLWKLFFFTQGFIGSESNRHARADFSSLPRQCVGGPQMGYPEISLRQA